MGASGCDPGGGPPCAVGSDPGSQHKPHRVNSSPVWRSPVAEGHRRLVQTVHMDNGKSVAGLPRNAIDRELSPALGRLRRP